MINDGTTNQIKIFLTPNKNLNWSHCFLLEPSSALIGCPFCDDFHIWIFRIVRIFPEATFVRMCRQHWCLCNRVNPIRQGTQSGNTRAAEIQLCLVGHWISRKTTGNISILITRTTNCTTSIQSVNYSILIISDNFPVSSDPHQLYWLKFW